MPDDRIDSAEAARRLGVKVDTLYAYVSRGLLTSRRQHGARGSTFDPAEVETLAAAGARARRRHGEPFAFPSISTSVALVTASGLYYRGADALALSRERSFEEVASWIWSGQWTAEPFRAPEATRAIVRATVQRLPNGVDPIARLRVAVTVAGAVDHLRFDVAPAAVEHASRTATAAMVDGLGPAPDRGDVASRLWHALAAATADRELLPCLHAALILLADHGLAASTVAARAAASARAHPYAVISAGLGALDGPLHGGASFAAYRLLERVVHGAEVGPELAEYLRHDRPIPGIGLYNSPTDPRASVLLARLAEVPAAAPVVAAVDTVTDAVRGHGDGRPNIDMALAALSISAGMPAGAGEALFGVARSVGWIAHALEEYEERPLRWRGRELYTGPQPSGTA